MSWPFREQHNLATITLWRIVREGAPIRLAAHNADGTWQFLDNQDASTSDAALVSLQWVFNHDPSIAEVADLPRGWMATRERVGGPWSRQPSPPEV